MSSFVDVTDDWNRKEGGERYVRTIDEFTWISVLHRLTGFGHMEWETAICFKDPETMKSVAGSPFMIRGDWREELESVAKEELIPWFESKKKDHATSFQQVMDSLRKLSETEETQQ